MDVGVFEPQLGQGLGQRTDAAVKVYYPTERGSFMDLWSLWTDKEREGRRLLDC